MKFLNIMETQLEIAKHDSPYIKNNNNTIKYQSNVIICEEATNASWFHNLWFQAHINFSRL